MNYNNNDIIIARSTPIGSSALAVIRISGESSLLKLLPLIFNKKKPTPRYNYTIELQGFESNEKIDTCVASYYQAPSSFTGEHLVELSCHGNDFIVEKIINEFIKRGVRLAYPGEFSYRAFQNKKIDLMQAESIAAKISSNSATYGVALQNIENGSFSKKLLHLKESVLQTASIIEHELDFNEQEITHLQSQEIQKKFELIKGELGDILKRSETIKKINRGYRVVILGLPNAGKSTLFNKILGLDKSIVTPIKGTTRDVLEEKITVKNIPFTFYDTAGYRKTKDIIETLGVQKGIDVLKNADIVLVVDAKSPNQLKTKLINEGLFCNKQKVVLIKTKCDALKGGKLINSDQIHLSAKNNVGINALLTLLLTFVSSAVERPSSKSVVLCNERQAALIKQAKDCVGVVLGDLKVGCSMDIVASGCRDFIDIIQDLLGEVTSDEILNNIFKGFCVGK